MKLKYTLGAALLIIVILGFFFTQQPSPTSSAPSAEVTMKIEQEAYSPVDIEIKKGTKVIFKNESGQARWPASNIHPTHGIYPEFDPKQPVNPGDSWSFVFDKVGAWKYHDHLVPSTRGIITVTP